MKTARIVTDIEFDGKQVRWTVRIEDCALNREQCRIVLQAKNVIADAVKSLGERPESELPNVDKELEAVRENGVAQAVKN